MPRACTLGNSRNGTPAIDELVSLTYLHAASVGLMSSKPNRQPMQYVSVNAQEWSRQSYTSFKIERLLGTLLPRARTQSNGISTSFSLPRATIPKIVYESP